MELPWEALDHWIASLALGLLIGVVSERRESARRSMAGIRTHALTALLGCAAWSLGMWPFAATLLVLGGLAVVAYWRSSRRDPGLTGEVTLLLSLTLGALSHQSPVLAAGLGVLCAILVHAKERLTRWSRVLLREQELHDGLLLAAAALVVMPLLPARPIDPWNVLQPATLWRVVVLVMAVGMLGQVLTRALGPRWGLLVTGFFSGLVSSTAAVASLGQRARGQPAQLSATVAAAMLAQLASLGLLAALLAAASMPLLRSMAWPLAAAAAGLLLAAVAGLRQGWLQPGPKETAAKEAAQAQTDSARAFRLSQALAIAAIMALVLLLAAWLQHLFGNAGVLVGSAVVALAEAHAAAAGLAQLHASGSLPLAMARWGVLATLAATVAAKSVLAFASGGVRYGACVSTGLGLMLAGAWLAA
ncbi:DUF4010 domain-containing protein [Comamonas sp. w2-DMI]|uniref:MgtC/SapB family protein n=1 Tax=Comamonas sp. w2-DMI TaxID=3126391 RepID=UPI0032E50EBF